MTTTASSVRSGATSRSGPADARWRQCPDCHDLVYRPKALRADGLCPGCGHHFMLTATERIAQLFDADSTHPLAVSAPTQDLLAFVDTVPYVDRLNRARKATGLSEAVVCVRARVHGHPVLAAVMDFRFLGGSLGAAVGDLITQTAEQSLATRTPLLLVCASGGARMQEGMQSLLQMAKTAGALADLDAAGILTVALVTDPTYGGVAASFGSLCDVTLAEPGARLGFAGPRVIAQTTGASLPAGFQTAEFLAERGLVDAVVPRAELRTSIARLLSVSAVPAVPAAATAPRRTAPTEQRQDPSAAQDTVVDPWQAVSRARHLDRPRGADYLAAVFDWFVELRGDRSGTDCPATIGGVASLDGRPVAVIVQQKGRTPAELIAHNFGMALPAGYRKADRIMRLAAKVGLPLITLIDTPGASPDVDAEEHGQAMAVAATISRMLTLPTPTIAVVVGEGGSGGALALGVADLVLAQQNSVYSVISPEGCAAILWRDPAAAPDAARALGIDAASLRAHGIVDSIVAEPDGGAHTDHERAAVLLHAALVEAVADVTARPVQDLVARRRSRYRRVGAAAVAAG